MKKHLLISILALMSWSGMAQVTFEKGIDALGRTADNYPVPYSLYSVKQTSDGGYIIIGSDILLIKTDSNGDTLWLKVYGGHGNDYSNSVIQTTDGGYFITGSTTSFGAGNYDVYIIKTDSLGIVTWSKTIGGTSNDYGMSGEQTSDGGYIITGTTNSFGAGSGDVYLIKTDSNGDTTWTKTYGGAGNDIGNCVKQTTDGGYVVTGSKGFLGPGILDNKNTGLYLLKTNSTGDTSWSKVYILSSDTAIVGVNYLDTLGKGYSVQQTTDGGYIIAGNAGDGHSEYYYAEAVFIKTNSSGNIVWVKNDDYALGLYAQQTMDGGYIMATLYYDAPSDEILSLIKTDSNGTFSWTQGLSYYWDTFVRGIDSPPRFTQTIDSGYIFAGSPVVDNGFFEPNLTKMDKYGNSDCNYFYAGGDHLASTQFQAYNYPASISSGGIVTTPTTIVQRPGGTDTTVCTTSTAGIKENDNNQATVSIYPNPFTSQTTIAFSDNQKNTTIKIADVLGKEIRTVNFTGKELTIERNEMNSGIYFLQITDEKNNVTNKKIIIQ